MSLDASKWAWTQVAEHRLSDRDSLMLLRIADHASRQEDGRFSCWPGIAELSEKTGRGEKTVRRALSSLEAAGLLSRERRPAPTGRGRAVDMIVLPVDGPTNRPERPVEQDDDQKVISTGRSEGPSGQLGTTKRSIEADQAVNSDPPIYRRTEKNRKGTAAAPQPNPNPTVPTCDGQPVTDAEYENARQALAAFNSLVMDAYPLDAHLERIVRCVRAEPQLTAQDHLAVVRSAVENPWWRGHPSPYVLWKTTEIFHRYVRDWQIEKTAPATIDYDANSQVMTV
jgi:hypothetical protein